MDSERHTLFYVYHVANQRNTKARGGILEVSLTDTFAKPRLAYVGAQDLWAVCFVRSTGTLLIATLEKAIRHWCKHIVSLSRYGEVLQVVDRVAYSYESVHLVELSGGKVLCGNETCGATQLCTLHVSRDHRLEFTARINVPEGFFRFDARVVDSNIHVALVDKQNAHVRLCLLLQSSSSLVEMSRVDLPDTFAVLWWGDRLLAGRWNRNAKSHAVYELQRADGALVAGNLLLSRREIGTWISTGDSIAVVDRRCNGIFLYAAS